jgi:hypothetical protein
MSNRKPNLFVVGSMKAGTTSLARYLGAHPEIFMTSDPKEPTYFLTREQLLDVLPGVEKRGFWRGEEYYLKLFEAAGDRTVVGEASANYARLPRVPGVAEKIHAFNPQARILFILRDPVARTISHYWYMVRFFGERRDLLTAIREDPDYVDTSNYALQLRPYLALFGRERVLAITTEALASNRRTTMAGVYRWLGGSRVPSAQPRRAGQRDPGRGDAGTRQWPAAPLPTFGTLERGRADHPGIGARTRRQFSEKPVERSRWTRPPPVAPASDTATAGRGARGTARSKRSGVDDAARRCLMRQLLRKLLRRDSRSPSPSRDGARQCLARTARDGRALPGSLRRVSPSGRFLAAHDHSLWKPRGVLGRRPQRAGPANLGIQSRRRPRPWRITRCRRDAGTSLLAPGWRPPGAFRLEATAGKPRQFSPDRPPAQLWWLDTEPASPASSPKAVGGRAPRRAPDGTVVFVSNRSGRLNLWRVNADGSGLEQLTDGAGPDYRPCVSPDGRTLAYFSPAPDGAHQVRLLSLATHEEIECTWTRRFKWSHGPFWCHDSRSLLLHALEHGAQFPALWLVVLSTGHITRLDTPGLPSASHGTLDRAERFIVCDSRDGPHTDCKRPVIPS